MKRKLLSIITMLLCVGTLTACSANGDSINGTKLEVGETVSVNKNKQKAEITLKSAELHQDIWSTADNSSKRHLGDVDGETYLAVILNIKNTGDESVDYSFLSDEGAPTVKFNDKNSYEMTCVDVDNAFLTYRWSIDPLKSVNVLVYQSIPNEIAFSPFVLTFTIGDEKYIVSQSSGLEEKDESEKDKPSESSKSEEVMRPSIKQKIDKAYDMQMKGDKAYSDWKKKYGDGKNVPKSEVAKASEEANKAIALLEEARRLQDEIMEMVDRGELNIPEMKYYIEKFGN